MRGRLGKAGKLKGSGKVLLSMNLNNVSQAGSMNRPRMVGSVVHQALSRILQQNISDPRIVQTTITEVELSRDLKHAKVYLTSGESKEALNTSVEHLNRARAYIRHRLSDRLDLKFTPAISFLADELPTRTTRVLDLIDQVSNETDAT